MNKLKRIVKFLLSVLFWITFITFLTTGIVILYVAFILVWILDTGLSRLSRGNEV